MFARGYDGVVGRQECVIQEWQNATGHLRTLGSDGEDGIMVSDTSAHNVQSYTLEGDVRVQPLGLKDGSPGKFFQPCQTALSRDRRAVAVADCGNHRVQLFDAGARCLLTSLGRKGKIKPGRLAAPEGVTFIGGRPEIIVADTGNGRLQIFHVDALTPLFESSPLCIPRYDPEHPGDRGRDVSGSRHADLLRPWDQSQSMMSGDARRLRDKSNDLTTRNNGCLEGQAQDKGRVPAVAQAGGGVRASCFEDEQTSCILVFNGYPEGFRNTRRTAGETESAEGPLREPCDVAYWREKPSSFDVRRSLSHMSASSAVATTSDDESNAGWVPCIPAWYRCGSFHDEEILREELLCPYRGDRPCSDDGCGQGVEGPKPGSFVVCETNVPDELRLLVVAKVDDDPDIGKATGDDAHETHVASSEDDSDGSAEVGWMDQLVRWDQAVLDQSHGDQTDGAPSSGLSSRTAFKEHRHTLLHLVFPLRPDSRIITWQSIEGLQRPSSVSFSKEGDLVVADQGGSKVSVYARLSGLWSFVHTFGPGREGPGPTIKVKRDDTHGKEPGQWSREELMKIDGKERKLALSDDNIDWAGGVPIAARFSTLKSEVVLDGSTHSPIRLRGHGSEHLLVATSDGKVRALKGPRQLECGMFAALHVDTVLRVVELLGYRPSQVVAYLSRAMAEMRARLRREWRLHPLTPAHLANIKLEFVQWGRLSSGEGVPGRGTAIDAEGWKLCDEFLASSACSRAVCPYSHEQPWIDPDVVDNESACILFRSGVAHAMTDLYGQVFVWQCEGDLFRLFQKRSFPKVLVQRRDPMTRGIYGAEVIRKCMDENHDVLDYTGFVDFATVVHEHVIGLRSWHARETSPASTSPRPATLGLHRNAETVDSGHQPPRQRASEEKASTGCRRSATSRRIHQSERPEDVTTAECRGDSPMSPEPLPRLESRRNERRCRAQTTTSKPIPSPRELSHRYDRLEAAPWLSWDSVLEETSAACDHRAINTSSRGISEGVQGTEEQTRVDEERATNRTYEKGSERGHSINKLIAFQTDRVVRTLDRLF